MEKISSYLGDENLNRIEYEENSKIVGNYIICFSAC